MLCDGSGNQTPPSQLMMQYSVLLLLRVVLSTSRQKSFLLFFAHEKGLGNS